MIHFILLFFFSLDSTTIQGSYISGNQYHHRSRNDFQRPVEWSPRNFILSIRPISGFKSIPQSLLRNDSERSATWARSYFHLTETYLCFARLRWNTYVKVAAYQDSIVNSSDQCPKSITELPPQVPSNLIFRQFRDRKPGTTHLRPAYTPVSFPDVMSTPIHKLGADCNFCFLGWSCFW